MDGYQLFMRQPLAMFLGHGNWPIDHFQLFLPILGQWP